VSLIHSVTLSTAGRRRRRAVLGDAGCRTVDFTVDDATVPGRLWQATRDAGLSLADRACLALASRLGVPAVTADRAWSALDVGVEVIVVR
jgi:ribonuclease VapC